MTRMDTFTACGIVEGFDGCEHTDAEQREAWQHLIDTGACWTLQGWYGRTAHSLIEQGVCKPAKRAKALKSAAETADPYGSRFMVPRSRRRS